MVPRVEVMETSLAVEVTFPLTVTSPAVSASASSVVSVALINTLPFVATKLPVRLVLPSRALSVASVPDVISPVTVTLPCLFAEMLVVVLDSILAPDLPTFTSPYWE